MSNKKGEIRDPLLYDGGDNEAGKNKSSKVSNTFTPIIFKLTIPYDCFICYRN